MDESSVIEGVVSAELWGRVSIGEGGIQLARRRARC